MKQTEKDRTAEGGRDDQLTVETRPAVQRPETNPREVRRRFRFGRQTIQIVQHEEQMIEVLHRENVQLVDENAFDRGEKVRKRRFRFVFFDFAFRVVGRFRAFAFLSTLLQQRPQAERRGDENVRFVNRLEEFHRFLRHGNAQTEMIVDVAAENLVELVGGALELAVMICFVQIGAAEFLFEAFSMRKLHLIVVFVVDRREKIFQTIDDSSNTLAKRNDDQHFRTRETLVVIIEFRVVLQPSVVRDDSSASLQT